MNKLTSKILRNKPTNITNNKQTNTPNIQTTISNKYTINKVNKPKIQTNMNKLSNKI